VVIATGLGANANELARDWPKGQYRGGYPDWMLVPKAIRAMDYNRGARFTGVVGKGTRAWMYDPNVYLYTPAQNAFVNNIGARPGELGNAGLGIDVDPATGREDTSSWTPKQAGIAGLVVLGVLGTCAWLLTSAGKVAR
jgi:hypothetical protein